MSPEALEYLRIIISAVSVAFAIYMGLRGNRRVDSEDREERIRTETRMDVKLNDVLSAAKDTRDCVKELQKDMQEHNNRIITLEGKLGHLSERVTAVERKIGGD